MKKVLLLFILFIIGLSSLPYWVGIWNEKSYATFIADLSRSSKLVVRTLQYEKSYLSTQAQTQIEILDESDSNKNIHLLLKQNILHGPIILEPQGSFRFYLGKIYSTVFVKSKELYGLGRLLSKEKPLEIQTILPYRGLFITNISSAGVKHVFDSDTQLRWKGIEARILHNKDFSEIKGDLAFPFLRYEEKDNFIEISDIQIKGDRRKNLSRIWIGDLDFKIDSFIVKEKQAVLFEISGLHSEDQTRESNGLITEEIELSLRKAVFGQELYGPGNGYFKFQNIDIKGFGRMQELLKKLQKKELTHEEVIEKSKQLLFYILLRKPSIVIEDLNIEIPDGKISFSGDLTLGGPTLENLEDQKALIQTIKAKSFAEIPKSIVYGILKDHQRRLYQKEVLEFSLQYEALPGEVPKQMTRSEMDIELNNRTKKYIQSLIEEGLLVEIGENYQIQILFRDSQMLMNGQPIEIPLR